MDIFRVLTAIGGLALLLYGMQVMGKNLEKLSGGNLEHILEKMTSNRLKAVVFGALVTAAVQSSSATTVMVVGFVNSGIMKLSQAVGIIMGANVGTTVTSWILSLAGLEGGGVTKLLKPTTFAPVFAAVGIGFLLFSKKEKRKDLGTIFIGFAILMFGMSTMSEAMSGLAEVEGVRNLLLLFSNPVLGMLAGMILTAIVQSSAASIGILQAFCASGAVTYGAVIPIVMGQNIGTCVTAVLSSIGASTNAKRAAAVHLYFNLIGTVLFMVGFYAANAVLRFPFLAEAASAGNIALIHSIFNVASTVVLFPFAGLLEKLALLTIRDENPRRKEHTEREAENENEKEKDEEEIKEKRKKKETEFQLLDVRFLNAPSYAMEQCKQVAAEMAEHAQKALGLGIGLLGSYSEEKAKELDRLEQLVDRYEDELGTYLVRLSGKNLPHKDSNTVSKILHCISDFERISDHAVNLMEVAKEMNDKSLSFSIEASEELAVFTSAVQDILALAVDVFVREDREKAKRIEPLEEVIDELHRQLKNRHIQRLREGECTIELGFVLSDILTNYERVADHCSNIGICTIQMEQDFLEAHEYAIRVQGEENMEFKQEYGRMKEKYRLVE